MKTLLKSKTGTRKAILYLIGVLVLAVLGQLLIANWKSAQRDAAEYPALDFTTTEKQTEASLIEQQQKAILAEKRAILRNNANNLIPLAEMLTKLPGQEYQNQCKQIEKTLGSKLDQFQRHIDQIGDADSLTLCVQSLLDCLECRGLPDRDCNQFLKCIKE